LLNDHYPFAAIITIDQLASKKQSDDSFQCHRCMPRVQALCSPGFNAETRKCCAARRCVADTTSNHVAKWRFYDLLIAKNSYQKSWIAILWGILLGKCCQIFKKIQWFLRKIQELKVFKKLQKKNLNSSNNWKIQNYKE
jgi:hypothetical protein